MWRTRDDWVCLGRISYLAMDAITVCASVCVRMFLCVISTAQFGASWRVRVIFAFYFNNLSLLFSCFSLCVSLSDPPRLQKVLSSLIVFCYHSQILTRQCVVSLPARCLPPLPFFPLTSFKAHFGESWGLENAHSCLPACACACVFVWLIHREWESERAKKRRKVARLPHIYIYEARISMHAS